MTRIQAIESTDAPVGTERRARLKKAAGEFEAQMMSELLKPMQNDPLFADGEDLGGSSATIQGMASQALGQAMAAHGGIGIAAKVMHSVSTRSEKIPAVAASGFTSGGYSRTGKQVTGQ
jgi:Rod binding domain-containing protein